MCGSLCRISILCVPNKVTYIHLNFRRISRTIRMRRIPPKDGSVSERAGQRCFLCLKKQGKQFAVAVPCCRPVKPRQIKIIELRNGDEVYHEMGPKEMSFESDAAVFERLKWACFESQGRWRKWIPFYGITNVEEIKVSHPYRDREFPP